MRHETTDFFALKLILSCNFLRECIGKIVEAFNSNVWHYLEYSAQKP